MKIEFLYKDNSYEAIISKIKDDINFEENDITYTPIVQVGLNIFSFSKKGENETTAKILDKIKKAIYQSLDENNLFIITDEVSSYYCQRLYPQIANFERGLRKVLYLASIKSKDEKAIEVCKQIEKKDFGGIYQLLFSDEEYATKAKNIVTGKTPILSKYDIIKQLQGISDSNLWDKLFKDEYSYIPKNFLSIKDGRNKIMHSHNISCENFSDIKNTLDKSNRILQKMEFDVLEKDNFNSSDIINSIYEAINAVGVKLAKVAIEAFSPEAMEVWSNRILEKYKSLFPGEESLVLDKADNIETVENKDEKELCSVD